MNVRGLVWVAVAAALAVVVVSTALAGGHAAPRGPIVGSALSPGDRLWVQRYSGPGANPDDPRAVGVSPDGSKVFVTGQSNTSASSDYATVAYDAATGMQLWAKRYNGPANFFDGANALGVSPDGSRVFVTGQSDGSVGFEYATIAYDAATGTQLWVKRYKGPTGLGNVANALGVSPDGSRVFVTGGSAGTGTESDYATVAYDAATGTQQWVTRYNGPASRLDQANALGVSTDGSRVFVTGESIGSGSDFDYASVAYDATTGTKLWVRRFNGPANQGDVAHALGVSPDGSRVFVTGESIGSGNASDYLTIAYNAATGHRSWVKRKNGAANGEDSAEALGVSPDGSRVFVTGFSHGSGSGRDYATVAYGAATGTQRWIRRYNGRPNDNDSAEALRVSPDGSRVFVTGFSFSFVSNYDYLTVAYNAATGQRSWVKRENGPAFGDDQASALDVSPDGSRLFVTGRSDGLTGPKDYETVAYSTG
jgi:PQQ-like domain